MKDEFLILSTTAILGYGFPLRSFEEGLKRKPHLIAADAGSTDAGPYYLGAGVSFTDRSAVKRDLESMITAGIREGIPVCIGSAGGCGARPHLEWTQKIVEEIAKEQHLSFTMAVISADISKERAAQALQEGRIHALDGVPPLTEEELSATTYLVGQMGMEPISRAFAQGAQVVLAGRAYDPSVFAALPVAKGYDKGLALHLGKILECAAICAIPGSGSDCMMGYLGEDYFRIEPLNPERKCTTTSVAAHTLYEKSNPYLLPGPGGHLDLHGCRFTEENGTVTVCGSRFVPSPTYTLKLEGARKVGCRTVSIAGTRDPVMIEKIDEILQGVRSRVADNFSGSKMDYRLDFKIYGRDGVMGQLEPRRFSHQAHEFGIIIEAVASTQQEADTICSFARSTLLHFGYPGRRSTAGNLAFPYSPSDLHAGEVFAFSVYHLMELDDPLEPFPVRMLTFAEGSVG